MRFIVFCCILGLTSCKTSRESELESIGGYAVDASNSITKSIGYVVGLGDAQGCSGALVGDRQHFLTAAHCRVRANHKIGMGHLRQTNQLLEIDSVVTHPCYGKILSGAVTTNNPNLEYSNYDLSIVKLKAPLPDHFQPLSISQKQPQTDDQVTVFGFGRTSLDDMKASDRLHGLNQTVLASPDVSPNFLVLGPINASQIESACSGDSGGPVVWTDEPSKIVAVVSGTYNTDLNCTEYTVTPAVTANRKWLEAIISGEDPDDPSCDAGANVALFPKPINDDLRGWGNCRIHHGQALDQLHYMSQNKRWQIGKTNYVSAPAGSERLHLCKGEPCTGPNRIATEEYPVTKQGRACFRFSAPNFEGRHELYFEDDQGRRSQSYDIGLVNGVGSQYCHLIGNDPDTVSIHLLRGTKTHAFETAAPAPSSDVVNFSAGDQFREIRICKSLETACNPAAAPTTVLNSPLRTGGRNCFRFKPNLSTEQGQYRAIGIRTDGSTSREFQFEIIKPPPATLVPDGI